MHTRQLRHFLAVIDNKGLTRAALKLSITQPALSRSISALEKELGATLFTRHGRQRLELNDAGLAFIGPARLLLRDFDNARAIVSPNVEAASRLDVATMVSPGMDPLAALFSAVNRFHPCATMHLDIAKSANEVVTSVLSGICEVGFIGCGDRLDTPGLEVVEVERQHLIVISKSPVTRDETAHREDLRGSSFIVPPQGTFARQLVDDLLDTHDDTRVVAEVADSAAILPLVLGGLGDAIMPEGWAQVARRAGAIAQRVVSEQQLRVVAVFRPTVHLSRPAVTLLDHARACSGARQ
ncbi:hypothetical protein XU06_29915 (plasmid) [Rhodococcus erythropolis]|uniref:LysR family transcriptional regulator n=1 Tax=Rhodococcus erythropolis TaxID=1833 RepID=UPI00061B7857|nr:LysR family transcriptional regulator [Rhodococcus erythropolis]AKE01166.1 hypothetical protein XU06_29915 [Rhodococcus erythropolis]